MTSGLVLPAGWPTGALRQDARGSRWSGLRDPASRGGHRHAHGADRGRVVADAGTLDESPDRPSARGGDWVDEQVVVDGN